MSQLRYKEGKRRERLSNKKVDVYMWAEIEAVGARISERGKSSTIVPPVIWAVYAKYVNIVLKIRAKKSRRILRVTGG